jgi:hypothetical protein
MDYLDVKHIKDFVQYSALNYDNSSDYVARDRASAFAKKYDLSADDLRAYRDASWLPPQQANPIKANVLDKVWQKEYAIDNPAFSDDDRVSFGQRFSIKNLIDEDPELQVKYLQRNGYKARYNTDTDQLEAARPGEPFKQVDPSGFDIEDVTDLVYDGVQAGIEGLATSFGGAFVPVIGAGVAGGLETIKQNTAINAGLRETYDPERIGTKAALGAVFPLLPVAAGGMYKGGRKAVSADIINAGEEMGAKPTLGMLTNDRKISYMENARWNQPRTIFNEKLQRQIEDNIEATDNYAEDLFKGRKGIDVPQAGLDIRNQLSEKLRAKLDRAEQLYNGVEKKLDSPGYQAATNKLYEQLDDLEKRGMYSTGMPADDQFMFWIGKKRKELDNVGTIGDLKRFNKNLFGDARSFEMSNPTIAGAAKELRTYGKAAIDDSFNKILNSLEEAAKNPKNKTPMPIDDIKQLKADFTEANNLYRQLNYDIDAIMKRPGKQTKGSVKTKIAGLEGSSVESVFNKVYSGGDVEKAKWLEANYPEEAATARGTILNDIFTKASQVRKGNNNAQSLGSALSQRIRMLSPSEKEILFGMEGKQKAEHLATWFANQPFEVGQSRQAYTEMIPMITNWTFTSPIGAFQYQLARMQTKIPKANFPLIGEQNLINNPLTRGASYGMGQSILIPVQSPPDSVTFP